MNDYHIPPVGIGRVISRGWDLSIRTLRTSGLLSFLVFVPLSLIIGVLGRSFVTAIIAMVNAQGTIDPNDSEAMARMFIPLAGSYMVIGLVSMLAQFLIPYTSTVAIMAGLDALEDRPSTLGDLFRRAFRRPFWYIIAQGIVVGMVMGAVYVVAMLIGVMLGVVSGGIGFAITPIVMGGAILYFTVATSVSKHEIIAADRGPMKSLLSSMELVKGNWLRIFLLVMLMMVVTWMLLLPVVIPLILNAVEMVREFPRYAENDPRAAVAVFGIFADFLSPWVTTLFGLITAGGLHVSTNILTALYEELRAGRAMAIDDEEEDWGTERLGEIPG